MPATKRPKQVRLVISPDQHAALHAARRQITPRPTMQAMADYVLSEGIAAVLKKHRKG